MKIVLLPGMDGTGKLFKPLLECVPKNVQIQVVPLLQRPNVSYQEQAKLIMPMIDQDVILLAESYSGRIAFEVAKSHGRRIKHLVFVASFLGRPSRLTNALRYLPTLLLHTRCYPKSLINPFIFGKYSNPSLVSLFHETMEEVPSALTKFRLRQIAGLNACNEKIEVPATYLQAQQDRLISPGAIEAFKLSFAELVISELPGSHFLCQTNPLGVWGALKEVLQ